MNNQPKIWPFWDVFYYKHPSHAKNEKVTIGTHCWKHNKFWCHECKELCIPGAYYSVGDYNYTGEYRPHCTECTHLLSAPPHDCVTHKQAQHAPISMWTEDNLVK